MTFIDDDVLPVQLAQGRLIVQDVLVGRNDDVELLVFEELGECRPLVLLTLVGDNTDGGGPLCELGNPVLDRDQRHNDKVWALVSLISNEICEEGDSLDGLAETHLVGQDSI